MSKGIPITDTPGGRPGLVTYETASQYDDVYEVSTVKNPKYDIGDKIDLSGGRRFRYCLSGAACDTYKGNVFYNAIPATGIDYSLLAEAAAKGATEVKMTNQGVVAQTLDGLKGGNIHITEGDNATTQEYGIIGNTAGGVDDVITIYLDAGLTAAVTVAWYGFCMPSPYSDVRSATPLSSNGGKVSFVGYATAVVNAADLYHWEQTAGPRSASLYGNVVGKTIYARDVVFRFDGNLRHRAAAGVTGLEAQRAGYILDNNIADNGATFIMLQLES